MKLEEVGSNESPRVRSLLVTAQLVIGLQVVSNVVSYACRPKLASIRLE